MVQAIIYGWGAHATNVPLFGDSPKTIFGREASRWRGRPRQHVSLVLLPDAFFELGEFKREFVISFTPVFA